MHRSSLQQPVNANQPASTFALQAREGRKGVAAELVAFIRQNKKWWLTPIILALLLVGILIVLGGTAAAPFIYTIF
jgi:hypothetical protein